MAKTHLSEPHRHAKKGRALGLGVMGWHSFLQQERTYHLTLLLQPLGHTLFLVILDSKAEATSRQLAVEYGEPTMV